MTIPQIKMMPIGSLTPAPKNPRTISDPRFKKLCKGLEDCPGLFTVRPCLCSDRTGKSVIYAGNMRYRAAQTLGWKKVPAIVETLTEAEERQRMVRDNVELGEFNMEILANEWDKEELEDWGLNIALEFDEDKPLVQEEDIRPYKHVNIFISIPIDRVDEIEGAVDILKSIEGAYYEQSAN